MSSANILPCLFEKRWMSGNFKNSNKFSQHDNYNIIQNFGEYIDTGYGKRYIEDKIHQSNKIFKSNEPFAKRDKSASSQSSNLSLKSLNENLHYHKRFYKNHKQKILCTKDEKTQYNVDLYLKQKNFKQSENSLNFESELFKEENKRPNLIATEPYRQAFIHPWKYSYKPRDYQTCTEQFRRVKSSLVDLSKY